MESKRILNRIVFINIANTDYASVEIAGNTCFVGTNNMGKTTLQRAILFFYSANTRQLGISPSQKSFEDYYFQYPNSYIIYEVATEEGLFHVMVYRNTKLFYRFVNAPFNRDFYIHDQEAVLPKAVLTRLNEHKVEYSDQIETFERYRNIIYGADPDKRYKKFALMKGNANYHNIPLAITSIFLSSESVIRASFVKECIANAIGSKHTTIELKTVERQLRQFTERYHDIETYFRRESQQRSQLINDNFSSLRKLKIEQRTLATDLGGALKYAAVQKEEINVQAEEKMQALTQLDEDFKAREANEKEKNAELQQEIGVLRHKLKEAEKKQEEYDDKGIADLLREAEEKPTLLVELQARENEYNTLTASFSDVEQRFRTLFDTLENERKEFEFVLQSEGLQLDRKFQEDRSAFKEEFSADRERVQQEHAAEMSALADQRMQYELRLSDARHKETHLRQKVYFGSEVKLLNEQLQELRAQKHDLTSRLSVIPAKLEALQKQADHVAARHKDALEQRSRENEATIAKHEEAIGAINEKLGGYQTALFGYLEEHYPDWRETIGKVVNEDILFNKALNPQLVKKSVDTLYGVKLNLAEVEISSMTLEEYEQQRMELREEISKLQQEFLEFREQLSRQEQAERATISRKIAQLKKEGEQAQYDLDQNEQKVRQCELDLHEYKRKGDEMREKELVEVYELQKEIEKELEGLSAKKDSLKESLTKRLSALQEEYQTRLAKRTKLFDREVEKIKDQREDRVAELEKRRAKLQKEKSAALKEKGIDDRQLVKVKKEIDSIKAALAAIEENAQLVSEYRKDKRELFDRVGSFRDEKLRLEERMKEVGKEFEKERERYRKEREHINQELSQLKAELKQHVDGLQHYESHFKDRGLYDRLRHLIEAAPAARSERGIIGLCSQLQANDNEYFSQFEKFRNHISDFAGRFRSDNHFNFRIDASRGEAEYERFAAYLEEFQNENKIQISIAEVAKSHGMLIDAIAGKMRALTEFQGRISKMISKMEADFSKASFESSKLIEYIKLKSEESENKVLRKLQRITEFREQNPFLYGEENLFNTGVKGKNDIDKKSVELLHDLHRTIEEEHYDEINVQDLFELRFRIKEGKNDTGWIEKIDKVGSTGTDMLVKAVIYITLLNVFIRESTAKTARNFKVHCIIDEVGQISAPYLKQLIAFAEERNICLINGLPNESKLETHYNYTYKFRRDSHGYVKVVPLLTMTVEP